MGHASFLVSGTEGSDVLLACFRALCFRNGKRGVLCCGSSEGDWLTVCGRLFGVAGF